MVDIEIPVFSRVKSAVEERFLSDHPGLILLNDRPEIPESFPSIVLTELSNGSYVRAATNDLRDRYAELTYSLDVFTLRNEGGKTLAKALASAVDETMLSLRFTRLFLSPVPNTDRGIVRYAARYRAVAAIRDTAENEEENLIYQMYRK